MITSGLMFFSRLICSICWRSWLAMCLRWSPWLPAEFHFQPSVRDLLEGDAREHAALVLETDADHALGRRLQAPAPVPAPVHELVARDLRELAEEARVVREALERPVQARRADLEGVRRVDRVLDVEDRRHLL